MNRQLWTVGGEVVFTNLSFLLVNSAWCPYKGGDIFLKLILDDTLYAFSSVSLFSLNAATFLLTSFAFPSCTITLFLQIVAAWPKVKLCQAAAARAQRAAL